MGVSISTTDKTVVNMLILEGLLKHPAVDVTVTEGAAFNMPQGHGSLNFLGACHWRHCAGMTHVQMKPDMIA
jgi:hypothetical protein